MKTIKKIFLLLILIFVSISCSDFLEEENLGNITAESYYTTEEGYESLVNAAYSSLRDVYEPTPYIFSAGTDLFFNAHLEVPVGLSSYQTLTSGNPEVEHLFSVGYQSIQKSNMAIEYSEGTEDFPDLETRIAEVKTLRAYLYFILVQNFGGLSIVTDFIDEPVTSFDRQPPNEVYEFIISELSEAIEALPQTQSDFGRITKRAAQHILAKVYLTRGYEDFGSTSDFQNAETLAQTAIGGQGLNISFDELFAYENDNNEEVLWSLQYSPGSTLNGGAHNWDYPWGPLVQSPSDGVNKKNALHPTEFLFTLFQDKDSRFEGTFMNVKTSPYSGWRLDPDNTQVDYYYPRTATQIENVDNWRAENPETRTNTIISPIDEHWWDPLNDTDFPALKKYDRLQIPDPDTQYTHDLYLARLGETYLIAAEAAFQNGELSRAVGYINEVRERAAYQGAVNEMQITSGELDLDFILDERARELTGEGHRWLDLKRTGKLIERTILYNPDISSESNFMGNNGNFKILRPIPLSAISLDDGDYPQNPAYAN